MRLHELTMAEEIYAAATRELTLRRRELAPEISRAFDTFGKKVFAAGALLAKTKQVIAVAVAHVTQCPYCIRGHTRAALREGASDAELMEAIWVAAELRAGGSYAHSLLALEEMQRAVASNEQGRIGPAGEHDVG